MVSAVAKELGPIDLVASWVIGDQWRDIAVANAVGARGILVRTGHGAAQELDWPADVVAPSAICDNLIAAVTHILGVREYGSTGIERGIAEVLGQDRGRAGSQE